MVYCNYQTVKAAIRLNKYMSCIFQCVARVFVYMQAAHVMSQHFKHPRAAPRKLISASALCLGHL